MLVIALTMLDSYMNDPKSSLPNDSGQRKQTGAPVSPSRRLFAKGAAPVVLGSLLSKPVLGAEYICTVSGNASGNASAHLTDDAGCDVGMAPNEWKDQLTWPAPFKKGTLPAPPSTTGSGNCVYPGDGRGTLFNGYTPAGGPSLANQFWTRNAQNATEACGVRLTPGDRPPSSMFEVLNSNIADPDMKLRLGKATIASLLNEAHFGTTYPVSAARIVEMFNAVQGVGSYHVAGANVSLNRLGVIKYFESLYS
jgi:hypothetical protein